MVENSKILLLFISLVFSTCSLFGAEKSDSKDKDSGAVPNYGIIGSARLSSNFVDRGLTYSDARTAFNAAFLMHLGSQFKFGIWGSNISNLSSDEDNLWVKYIGQVFIDFQQNSKMLFYVHDDHFYKSDVRNGQRFGFKLDYARFTGLFEYNNNYEGSGSSSTYFNIKFTKKYSDKIGLDLALGYTFQNSSSYNDYADLSGVFFYKPTNTFRTEAGLTLPSNTHQFGSRSQPAYFIALSMNSDGQNQ